jgi:hypothetical protein
MKLNRTQALFLVGTIAAVGCVVESSDDDSTGDDNEAGAGGSAGSATGGQGGSSGSAGTTTGGTSGSGGEGGGATCLGDERDPQVTCGEFMGAGGVGAGGDGYGGGGGSGPTCDEMAEAQADFCTGLWTNLKPAVANDARTCMNAQSPEDICTWAYTYGCAQEAILAACPDETADDECETIHADCADIADIPVSECSLVLSGMTQAGRDAVVACEYCDLWFCAGVLEE